MFYKAELPEWDEMDIPDPTVTTYTLRSLNCGTKYQFHVVAYNDVGRSEASDVVTLTTQGGCKLFQPILGKRNLEKTQNEAHFNSLK